MEGTEQTTQTLFDLLRSGVNSNKLANIDPKTLNYALYARKSTIGDERQEHSVEDQIAYCVNICVKPNSLNVVTTIKEHGSAKEPDIRPKFKAMIESIKNGEIDGIICYHPDRLSRNMKEAGELIDLLDKRILKDLQFATSRFENSPTGKMLLGISFVLSKQYSENLSENVIRGNTRATEERGQYLGKRVHGYYITKDRQLMPDGNNFAIIKDIFEHRLKSVSQPEIAKWANKQGYMVRRKGDVPKIHKWTKQQISDLLKDPVYAGVLKYGNSIVKLEEFYDFTPVVSVEDFFKLNKVSDFQSSKLVSAFQGKKDTPTRANLLRGIVTCYKCKNAMSSGISSKTTTNKNKIEYYYYRCGTKGCNLYNKSARAKVVVSYAIEFLKSHKFITKDNYEHYIIEAKADIAEKTIAIKSSIGTLSKQLGEKRIEYENAKKVVSSDPEGLGKHFNLDEIKQELTAIENDLNKYKSEKNNLNTSVITFNKYLELFTNLGETIEVLTTNGVNIDALNDILEKFFSNFELEATDNGKLQWSVKAVKLKEPYEGFLKSGNVVLGRG
jgi:DNA invertase Pin-like site-specific DNA recombinase